MNHILTWAAENGHLDVVKLLVKKGANDYNGAMFKAVIKGHTAIVKFLVKKCSNLNPPMILAVKHNHLDIVKILVAYGADDFAYGFSVAEDIKISAFLLRNSVKRNIFNEFLQDFYRGLTNVGSMFRRIERKSGPFSTEQIEEIKKTVLNYGIACILDKKVAQEVFDSNFDHEGVGG